MEKNFGNAAPDEVPGKKHVIDPEPAIPSENPGIPVPGDPLEIDPGKDDVDPIGDGDDGLGDSFEKPHKTSSPSAESDGIRDGDREAPDEIAGDDEQDYPRN